MGLVFPNVARATEFFISGQNWTIDNFGKTVTLFYHTYVSGSESPIGPGNMGTNFLADGSTAFSVQNNFLASSGQSAIEVQTTGQIKLLCTLNNSNISEKYKKEPEIGIEFKKGLTYIYSKGYMDDYQKVINCDYAIFSIPASSVDQMKFRRASHPRDKNSIAQGEYFNCWWEQIA